MSKNLYIFGSDANARFLASQFASRHDSWLRTSLLFHKDPILKNYFINGSKITYENALNRFNPVRITYEIPALLRPEQERSSRQVPDRHIDNLIVTNPDLEKSTALQEYKEYISEDTNVIFVNPGLGAVETATRGLLGHPHIWQALSTHIVENGKNFDIKHLKAGDFRVCACPTSESFLDFVQLQEKLFPNDREVPMVIKKLLELPMLGALYFPYKEVYTSQLEKVMVDCCIYPLVSLFETDLQRLSSIRSIERTISSIIDECLLVLGNLNRVKSLRKVDPTINAILDKQRMFDIILQIIGTVNVKSPSFRNSKSTILQAKMLPSVGFSRRFDLRSTNGYIVKLGREQNIDTPVNRTLMDLVVGRQSIDNDNGEVIL
ncbi:hypothetical protein FOA43_002395 [Brettanomyces nanus]|uniref:Ketopantoate reductase C-terminal domain-containing protein n=1 Tax=Eeniella nana TaxID=13502 RepID=A0A875S3V8_EENNA|nr:uncharacterized protein FOA43_002395 [Brettanomyces nanus]QPG75055.1 hypothetical protein FOA43_002395 [Brettanomyces nanus]